jgi:hypothetical protein
MSRLETGHLNRLGTAIRAASVEQIATIEALWGAGRSLETYETPDLNAVMEWLADKEVLDPEDPSKHFEPLAKRGLFRRFGLMGKL